MKRLTIIIFIGLLLTACHTTKKTTSSSLGKGGSTTFKKNTPDRDGSSFAKAVIIEEKSEGAGINAEYTWLAQHFPGYTSEMQTLSYSNNIPFDILKIKTRDGEELDIYFDISNYFGKW